MIAACYGPTELVTQITTDVGCDTVRSRGIAIRTAGGTDGLATAEPATESTRCEARNNVGDLGTLTFIPSGDTDEIAVEVLIGVDRPTKECRPPLDVRGCIVARRRLSFVRHQSLRVRIDLNRSCVGVLCAADQTCDRSGCVSAIVPGCPDGDCTVGTTNSPDSGGAETGPGPTGIDGAVLDGSLPTDGAIPDKPPVPCGPDFCESDMICCCEQCRRGITCPGFCP